MMHARHLVRRLLRLRQLRQDLLDGRLDIAQGAQRHPQSSNDPQFGQAPASVISHKRSEADKDHIVHHPQLGEVVDVAWFQRRSRLNDQMLSAADQHRFFRQFDVGHALPLDAVNHAFTRALTSESRGKA